MRLLTAFLPVLLSLIFFGASNASSMDRCLKGLGPALVAGSFSGSVDCQRDKLSVWHVGHVREFGRTFEIYSYRYRLKPTCPECAVHGGHRVIFMEHGRYAGQYRSDFARVAIRDGHLTFLSDSPDAKWVTVKFTAKGPAKSQWDGGEVLSFFRLIEGRRPLSTPIETFYLAGCLPDTPRTRHLGYRSNMPATAA